MKLLPAAVATVCIVVAAAHADEASQQTLRDLILGAVNETPSESPRAIGAHLERVARDRGWTLDSITLEEVPGYPNLLVATTTAGNDTSLDLLEKKDALWTLALEQNDTAQMGLQWRIAGPAGQDPFLVTASTSRAESGSSQTLRWKITRAGANPRMLFEASDTCQAGDPWQLSATDDSFVVRYTGKYALDAGRWGRAKVARFSVHGDRVTRVDPIADLPDEFVDEWVSLPWQEAKRWTAPERRDLLRDWHDQLRAGEHLTKIDDRNSCKSDGPARFEIAFSIDTNDESMPHRLVALVERTGDHFLLRDLRPLAEWDETVPERTRCPRKDLVLTSAGPLQLVLKEGIYHAGPRDDFHCPTGYSGTVIARVTLGNATVDTPLGEQSTCAGAWTLFLGDYNGDGQADFNIGVQENSVNSFYQLFTVGPDGHVAAMKVRHADGSVDDSITAATTGNSTAFEITAEGIRAKSLSNPADPKIAFWTTLYRWSPTNAMFEEGEQTAERRSR